jgi:PAS domain S-box-containing protein
MPLMVGLLHLAFIDAADWNLQITTVRTAIIATSAPVSRADFLLCAERTTGKGRYFSIRGAIRKSEEEFRTVFEKGPLGMAISDARSRFIKVNPMFCTMLGYSQEELLTKSFADITHPDHLKEDIAQVKRLSAGEIPEYTTEKQYIKKNGDVIWASVVVSVVRDMDGKFLYYLAMISDISERKAVEEEMHFYTSQLQQYADALAQTNDKLNLLNSITRHDILNQLTVILGYLEIMKIKFPDPALRIYRQGNPCCQQHQDPDYVHQGLPGYRSEVPAMV